MKKLFVSIGVLAVAATFLFTMSPKGVAQEEADAVKPAVPVKTGFSEYIIVRGNVSNFNAVVNAKLKEGFQPQGGLSFIKIPLGEDYAQAMVR